MRQLNAMDFDDVLGLTVALLRHDNNLCQRLASKYKHLLVDEFQDTNQAQYELIRLLAKASTYTVGDPDQAIYEWRGSNPHFMSRALLKDFPCLQTFSLRHNYRSSRRIVATAGHVIAANDDWERRELHPTKAAGPRIEIVSANDRDAEAAYLANEIEDLLLRGDAPADQITVLYRSHSMSKKIEEQLVLHRIPFVVVDGTLFWKRKEIQDVMAYLRLAVGLQDDTALLRIINTPKRKIGAASVDRLVAYARAAGVTLSALLFGAPAEQRGEGMAVELPPLPSRGELGIKPKAEQALQGFRELVANLHAVARTAPLPHLLAEIVEQTSFREHLLLPGKKEAGGGRMNGKEALERLEQLIASAKEFWPGTLSGGGPQEVLGDEEEGAPDAAALSPLQHAQAFLLESALHSAGDDAQQAQRVRLMTMHAAKGLEFEVVFVVGCEDAQLPGLRGDDDCGELYAARRLFYVALTRAKSRLLLSHALQDPGGWGGQFMEPSRSGRGGASRALNTAIHGWSIQYQTAVLRWC